MPETADIAISSSTRRVWQLAWPTIVSNLLFTTVGFMHIKIVSGLGTHAVAAVTTGHRVFFLVQAILMGVSVATTALVARNWGAGNRSRAELVNWTSLALSILLAGFLSIPVLLVPGVIAGLFGLDQQSTEAATEFIFWLGLFNVSAAINLVLSTSLRATGDVITPLCFLFFSSFLNVLFGYLLAFGIGPLPRLEVAGVALGGGTAGFLVTLAFVLFWWGGTFNLKPVKKAVVDWGIGRQLITIGTPSVVEQGIIQISFLVFFGIVAQYGTQAFAAYGIGITLVSFSIVVGFGFGIATATLVGQHLGAGHRQLAIKAGWRGLRMAVAAMTVLSVLQASFAENLARFIIDDPVVVDHTTIFIYMIAVSQPMMACEFTLGGALRGAGDTRFPLVATFCGIAFGRLLPAWLFLSLGLSVYWIFAVMMLDYAIKATLIFRRFRSSRWLDVTVSLNASDSAVDSDKKNT